WLPDAYARFDVATQRLDVSIPQAAMRRSARGYVNPSLWDRGVNAGFISYALNWYGGRDVNATNSGRSSDSAYMGITSGLNLGNWQFRHNSSYSWHSNANDGSRWQNISTYAQRAFPNISSMLTVGDAYTGGELFDSIGFRGINLATDDRMLPDSLRGYAPIIRGIAQSNARVEIRQNGQLIYNTTVAPGAFVIDDLYPTGYGGDLHVTIYETDGRQQQFSVPYGSVPQMLRVGSQRHSLTVGKIRNDMLRHTPYLLEGTYQRGISNRLTAYAGSTISQRYVGAIAGTGISTPVGAFSLDATVARTKLRSDTFSGTSVRLSYSKLLSPTNTNVTLAAYRYSTSGFYGLQDAIMAMDYERQGISSAAVYRQRSQLQLTVNQSLGPSYGALYLTGSARQYWNQRGSTLQYQAGYNVSYKGVSYGLSVLRSQTPSMRSDTQLLFTASIPLGKTNPVTVTSDIGLHNGSYDTSRVSIFGSAGKENVLTYGIAASDTRNSDPMIDSNVQYRSRYAALSGSYSYGRNHHQMSLGASGTMVVHSGGVTLAPQRGDTMVIVEAPAAKDAQVSNISGLRIDQRGYAVIPYVSPYRMNTITLDPEGMNADVELESSSKLVAPYAGAISKVTFGTRKGRALIINAPGPNGQPLPFGAQVLDAQGQSVGLVAQGSLIYIRANDPQGRLTIKWGDQAAQQCHVEYQLPLNQASPTPGSFTTLETVCR
ncbi:MAG TPA: fimbria/pilus outer membrane usher protein, partial [Xylella sp.]